MSAAARWANSATATVWPLLTQPDWKGPPTFGAPVTFDCDYKAEAKTMTDSRGREFTTRQIIYTERATINAGDRVLIGASTTTDPVAAGAWEVRSVQRFSDTFDRQADDYVVAG